MTTQFNSREPFSLPHSFEEASRVSALRSLGLLDTPAEKEFDDVVQLAAQACSAPISLFSLVDERRQWFKASLGLGVAETGRELSFCSHAIEEEGAFVVEDAATDPRFMDNDLVVGAPHIRFYAGIPIHSPGGHPIGTLCVIDTVPRSLTLSQTRSLQILAGQVQGRIREKQRDREAALVLVANARKRVDVEVGRRVEAEDNLRALNELLNSVLESTLDSIMTVNADWTIVYMNSKASELPSGNVVGQPFWEMYPDLIGTFAETNLRRAMDERVQVEHEIFYAQYGRWYKTFANPYACGISLFFRDITEHKALDEQLERERVLREQRIEALSHMAGGLAHEISNPLAIVHALISDVRDAATSGRPMAQEEIASICGEAIETADRASKVLRGLRTFANDSSKEPKYEVAAGDIVRRAMELQATRFARGLVTLALEDRSDGVWCLCREVQILQIMTNLLGNAFDAIDEANPEVRAVQVAVETADGECVITVTDSGPGVKASDRGFLMTPFFTTKSVGAGLGVGLSLSKAIAQDHGGSLSLDAGLPTCFRLKLPAVRAAEVEEAEEEERGSGAELEGGESAYT
jgi:two-component system NtrC family sensor kinase